MPRTSSSEFTGETLNSSIAPESRSRTKESAVSVTAMCCSISANAAGAANATTLGWLGATFVTSATVGWAMTSGGISASSPAGRWHGIRLTRSHGALDDLLVDALRDDARQKVRVSGGHGVHLVEVDLDLRLLARLERLRGVRRRHHDKVQLVRGQCSLCWLGVRSDCLDMHARTEDVAVERRIGWQVQVRVG